MTELERSHQLQQAILDAYRHSVADVGNYSLELDEQVTREFRKHVAALAEELSSGRLDPLDDVRATLRSLLRDFRDKGIQYLSGLRDELAGTARALEEILDALNQSDGDHKNSRQMGHWTLGSGSVRRASKKRSIPVSCWSVVDGRGAIA